MLPSGKLVNYGSVGTIMKLFHVYCKREKINNALSFLDIGIFAVGDINLDWRR